MAAEGQATVKRNKVENAAIANALQLEFVPHRASPYPLVYDAQTKFGVAQPIHCRLDLEHLVVYRL